MTRAPARRTNLKSSPDSVPGGDRLFQRMFTRLGCQGRPPRFIVEFYPYANLVHTIRLREDSAYVRLSDILRRAPMDIVESAAAILLGRLYRRRAPRELILRYSSYTVARGTHRRVNAIRLRRGRRIAGGAAGRVHDLAPMFSGLNHSYFGGRLPRPRLGWSTRNWRAQLGCFDPGLDQIVINTRLDREGVPAFVVEYVLYHEMLHVRHPIRVASCGLQSHSAAFREEERKFGDYERARKFLQRM